MIQLKEEIKIIGDRAVFKSILLGKSKVIHALGNLGKWD